MLAMSMMFVAPVFAEEEKNVTLEDNQLANRIEFKDMNRSLNRIDRDLDRIETFKAELKANRKADDDIAVHMSKKELWKARADLRRDRRHLRIDKRDLRRDQRYHLNEIREAKWDTKCELWKEKRALRKAIRQEDEALIQKKAERVMNLEYEVVELEKKKEDLKEDVDELFSYIHMKTVNVYSS